MLRLRKQLGAATSSNLRNFDWTHRGQIWEYSYTVLSPDHRQQPKTTFALFPSSSLLSTREEWRECAEFLCDSGYRCLLIDFPGWHQRNIALNWAIEEDVQARTLVSAYTQFAYTALKHIDETYIDGPLHLAAAGGNTAIHIRRALEEANIDSPTRFKSMSCFSPTWRFYLARYVPEGYPRKFARRQSLAETLLDACFVRSKTMYRIYKSKIGLSKLTKRMYEEPIQSNPERLESKREVITRDRPLSIDAAMITSRFDPVQSTEQFISELFGSRSNEATANGSVSDDDEDDDNLLSIKVPQWAKNETIDNTTPNIEIADSSIKIHLIIPEDAVGQDKAEMRTVVEWANHHNAAVSYIPGRLMCHEESPALSASLLDEFVSNLEMKNRKMFQA
jgi:hypothetical protein